MDYATDDVRFMARTDFLAVQVAKLETVLPAVKGAEWGAFVRLSIFWTDGTTEYRRDEPADPFAHETLNQQLEPHFRNVRR